MRVATAFCSLRIRHGIIIIKHIIHIRYNYNYVAEQFSLSRRGAHSATSRISQTLPKPDVDIHEGKREIIISLQTTHYTTQEPGKTVFLKLFPSMKWFQVQ